VKIKVVFSRCEIAGDPTWITRSTLRLDCKGVCDLRNKGKNLRQIPYVLFLQILESVSKFTEVLAWPKLRLLDFREVPRTLRTKLLDLLPRLTGEAAGLLVGFPLSSGLSLLDLIPGLTGEVLELIARYPPRSGPRCWTLPCLASEVTRLSCWTSFQVLQVGF
jgi:hypothetical protein